MLTYRQFVAVFGSKVGGILTFNRFMTREHCAKLLSEKGAEEIIFYKILTVIILRIKPLELCRQSLTPV